MDMVLDKYVPAEKLAEHRKKNRSHFHIYDDKGVKFKEDLVAAGFKGVKIWEAA